MRFLSPSAGRVLKFPLLVRSHTSTFVSLSLLLSWEATGYKLDSQVSPISVGFILPPVKLKVFLYAWTMTHPKVKRNSKRLSKTPVPVLPEILITPPDSPVSDVLILDCESEVSFHCVSTNRWMKITHFRHLIGKETSTGGLLQVPEAAFLDMKEPMPPQTIWIPLLNIVPLVLESCKEPALWDETTVQMIRWRNMVSRL